MAGKLLAAADVRSEKRGKMWAKSHKKSVNWATAREVFQASDLT